jgi:hypothetical protein
MARPKNPGKKDLHRTIIAIPKEMHEALRRIAEKKTNETNGVIIYTISMVGREAFEEKIEKELGKGALNDIRKELVRKGEIQDPLAEEEISREND